jgi:hypothetical protein
VNSLEPYAVEVAALRGDLRARLAISDGLDQIIGTPAEANPLGELGHNEHAALVGDVAGLIDLSEGVDEIVGGKGSSAGSMTYMIDSSESALNIDAFPTQFASEVREYSDEALASWLGAGPENLSGSRNVISRGSAAEQPDPRVPNAMTARRAHEAARMRAKLTDPAKAYAELVEGLNWAHVRAGKPSLGSLSSQVDYSKATLSKVFTGKAMPSWVLVQRLGRYLNVPPGVVQGWYTMWTAANLSRRRADPAATGTGAGTVKTGYPCPKCGSWVVDTARHHGWHSEIEGSAPTLDRAQSDHVVDPAQTVRP